MYPAVSGVYHIPLYRVCIRVGNVFDNDTPTLIEVSMI